VPGFLTRAHLERQLTIEVVAADRAAEIEARLLVQGELFADLDRRIRRIDAAIEDSTRRGQPAVAMALGNSLHLARARLSVSRQPICHDPYMGMKRKNCQQNCASLAKVEYITWDRPRTGLGAFPPNVDD
jgi:hypothetical protein